MRQLGDRKDEAKTVCSSSKKEGAIKRQSVCVATEEGETVGDGVVAGGWAQHAKRKKVPRNIVLISAL